MPRFIQICLALCCLAALALAGPARAQTQAQASTPAKAHGVQFIKSGNAAAQAGKLKQAIALYSKAIASGQLSADNLAVAYNNRGSAKDDLGMTEAALKDFRLALKTKPDYAEAFYNRSFAYERKGLIKLALDDSRKAAKLKPTDWDYLQRTKYLQDLLAKRR